jgi:DNA (cytosine-5)-methyltransferase 1
LRHLGDITKISGIDAPTVNVIIGGSPCQDLSVAGKRAGLNGERSGLFMEQIRIIKEMREKDAESGRTGPDIRPRFMVWENVPGAFSVNGGRDFAAVLEETAKVADKEIPDIPVPADGWSNSGCIMGRGFSIAWRVLDAQFFGVPQRRRRIALVADFAGGAAPEILFERESVSGHSEPCEAERKGTAGDAADSTGTAISFLERAGYAGGGKGILIQNEQTGTLSTVQNQSVCYPETARALCARHDSSPCIDRGQEFVCYPTLTARMGTGGGQVNAVLYDKQKHGVYGENECSSTLTAHEAKEGNDIVCQTFKGDVCGTLDAHYAQCPSARGGVERDVVAVDCRNATESEVNEKSAYCEKERCRYIVRRLTPLEAERLQGYPDGWTDIGEWIDTKGKKHKPADSPRYKALGNSIAIPPWLWVLSRLNEYCEEKTMASLFDGIGGFPLIWEHLNGKGSAVWCSEIEEFPIAVTKRRFF